MRLEDLIAGSHGEEKARYERVLQDRKKTRSQITRRWYASLTPEQKAEQAKKISEARKKGVKKEKRGHARGVKHYLSRLTEDQVREINASQEKASDVAKKYGVSVTAVRNIWTGETWKHLKLPRLNRPDLRIQRRTKKPEISKTEPRISPELRAEILAHPFEGTQELAQRLGLHYFDVATLRLKHNGVYRKCQ